MGQGWTGPPSLEPLNPAPRDTTLVCEILQMWGTQRVPLKAALGLESVKYPWADPQNSSFSRQNPPAQDSPPKSGPPFTQACAGCVRCGSKRHLLAKCQPTFSSWRTWGSKGTQCIPGLLGTPLGLVACCVPARDHL